MTDSADRRKARSWWQFALLGYTVVALSLVIVLLAGENTLPERVLEATPMLLAAIGLTTFFGGIGPGLVGTLLAAIAVDYYFVPPIYEWALGPKDFPSLVTFVMSGLFFVWVTGALRQSQKALEAAHDEMEGQVRQRIAELRERADLLDLTHDSVFVRDINDVITFWNRGAEEQYGWTRDEALRRVSHELLQTIFPRQLEEITAELNRTGRWEGELIHYQRDGTEIVVASRWALQSDPQGNPRAVLETNNDITERKRAEQALEDLAGRLIHAQEQERSRIGRELHDHVSQRLGILSIKIDQLRMNPSMTTEISRALDELRQQTGEITEDIHGLSHRLHSSVLDHLGVVPAVQKLVNECSQRYAIPIAFNHASMPAPLPSDVALCLFRVVEESLTNIAKHSGTPSARVEMASENAGIRLTVADEGVGFDPAMIETNAGLGFVSMRERLRLVHGTIHVALGSGARDEDRRVDTIKPPRDLMKRPRILLADDHTLMVEALKHLLQDEFDVVGTAGDGRALLKAAAELDPELVVVDIGMPLLNGLDAAQQLKELRPNIKIIFLTQNREPRFAAEAFRRKASGYLLKDAAASELTAAIWEALKGGWYVSPALRTDSAGREARPDPTLRELSPREREVLQLLAEGKAMKEVASILDISPRTVEFHKYRIMELLGLKTGAELVQYAIKHGLISP